MERSRKTYIAQVSSMVRRELKEHSDYVLGQLKSKDDFKRVNNDWLEAQVPKQDFVDLFVKIYQHTGKQFGKLVFNSIKKKKALILKSSHDFRVDIFADMARAYITHKAGEKITGVRNSTINEIRKVIDDEFDEGDSIPDMARAMRDRFSQINLNRGMTIARTEVIAASNYGAMAGAEMTGIALQKEWIATQDQETRPDHAIADGKVVNFDDSFKVGGDEMDFPGDTQYGAGAENVINCRCTVAFIPL